MSHESGIAREKNRILKAWFEHVADTYAKQTASFLNQKGDRFANPVSAIISESLEKVFDGLVEDAGVDELSESIDPLVRVRAVQGFSPSASISFVFFLKKILRDVITADDSEVAMDLELMDKKIDGLALICFDKFMECREKIYELKACEVRNRTFRAFERAGLLLNSKNGG